MWYIKVCNHKQKRGSLIRDSIVLLNDPDRNRVQEHIFIGFVTLKDFKVESQLSISIHIDNEFIDIGLNVGKGFIDRIRSLFPSYYYWFELKAGLIVGGFGDAGKMPKIKLQCGLWKRWQVKVMHVNIMWST